MKDKDTELKKKIERSYQLLDEYNELAKSAELRDITLKDMKDVPLLTIESIKRYFAKHPDCKIESPFESTRKTLYLNFAFFGQTLQNVTCIGLSAEHVQFLKLRFAFRHCRSANPPFGVLRKVICGCGIIFL